jgi:hypothetical protein
MKDILIALSIIAGSLFTQQISYAAEPSKKSQTTQPKKSCDMLKDKNCNKAPPSANKPIPKKKPEAK